MDITSLHAISEFISLDARPGVHDDVVDALLYGYAMRLLFLHAGVFSLHGSLVRLDGRVGEEERLVDAHRHHIAATLGAGAGHGGSVGSLQRGGSGQVACFTRAEGVVDAQIDGEIILMAPTDRRCFGVNRTGTRVWELLPPAGAAGVTIDHLVERLMDADDVQRSVCLDEVARLRGAMVDAGVASSAT